MSCPHGASCMTTFGNGVGPGPGTSSMSCSEAMCGWPPANGANPALGSSIAVGQDHGNRGLRGFDAHTQVKGRTRHLLVATRGLILAVVVTAASGQDRAGAKQVLAVLRHQFSRLRRIWADGAYAGALVDWVWSLRSWRKVRLEIPKRWMVERTLGWFNRYRRLSKDDEL